MSRERTRFYPHALSSYASFICLLSFRFGGFGGNKNNSNNNNQGNSSFGSGSSTFGSGGSGSTFGSGGSTFGSGNNNNNMQQGFTKKESFTNSFLGGFCGAVIGNMILPLLHIK